MPYGSERRDAWRALNPEIGETNRAIVARSTSDVFDTAPWTRIPGTEFALYNEAAP